MPPVVATPTSTSDDKVKLYKCEATDWLWLPKPFRIVLGWIYVIAFTLCFFALPSLLLLAIPWMWSTPLLRKISGTYLVCVIASYLIPAREWHSFRLLGQLWYEIFDMHHNLSDEELKHVVEYAQEKQLALKTMKELYPDVPPFYADLVYDLCKNNGQDYINDLKEKINNTPSKYVIPKVLENEIKN